MASYVVMEPPAGDAKGRDAVLVRDGFHFLAFVFPFLWLFFHRAWLEGLAVLAAVILIGTASSYLFDNNAGAVLSILVSIYVGLEGSAMRLAAMRRRGWRDRGVVEAHDAADAELRYLAAIADDDDVPPPLKPWGETQARPASGADSTALGMLGYSGGR